MHVQAESLRSAWGLFLNRIRTRVFCSWGGCDVHRAVPLGQVWLLPATLELANFRANLSEAGLEGEKFPNWTSESIKARPFQKIKIIFLLQETTYLL
jgi:hypothetical protein